MNAMQYAHARQSAMRVGVIGFGAIGRPVVDALRNGRIPGCTLAGILTRSGLPDDVSSFGTSSLHDLIDRSDLIVEAAGQAALASLGPLVVESGTDLLALSVGALGDDRLYEKLTRHGGGRLLLSTGAVGGLDTLSAAMLAAPLDFVSLVSRKRSDLLVRPWMNAGLAEALGRGDAEVEAFDGSAREAVKLFPESANIASTLALATVGFDRMRVTIMGVPRAAEVEHRVAASGRAGSYEFIFRNQATEANPRTSAITPFSVIRALRRMQARTVLGI